MAEKMMTEAELQQMLKDAALKLAETGKALDAIRAGAGLTGLPGGDVLAAGNTACDSGCDGSCTPALASRLARVLPAERTGGG